MTNREKMHSGDLYLPGEKELLREQALYLDRLYEFNQTRPADRRKALLRELFAEVGEGCYIEPPLHAGWAGRFVHLGRNVYANFNLTLVDDTHIYIGDNTMIGPNRSCPSSGSGATSSTRRSISGAAAGWGPGSSSCPASGSGTAPWWARAAWLPGTCPPMSWRWVRPAGSSGRLARRTGGTISGTGRSTGTCWSEGRQKPKPAGPPFCVFFPCQPAGFSVYYHKLK